MIKNNCLESNGGDMNLVGGREELSDRLVWQTPKFTNESAVV
jgi:hypothetical protein